MQQKTSETDTENKRVNFGPLWSVIRRARPAPWLIVVACVCLVIGGCVQLAVGQAVRGLFDLESAEVTPSALKTFFLWFWLVILGLSVATFGRTLSVMWLALRVTAEIRKDVYGHIVGLCPKFFDENKLGDVLARINGDVAQIQSVIKSLAPNAAKSIFIFVGGTIFMFITSVKLSLIFCFTVPLILIPTILFGRKIKSLSRQFRDHQAVVTVQAKESLNAIQTVQAFTCEDVERTRFNDAVEAALPFAIRRVIARACLHATALLLMFGLINVSVWFGALDLADKNISLGELVAFIIYAYITGRAAGRLSDVWGGFQAASGAAERVMEVLDTQSTILPPPNPVHFPQHSEGRIEFQNVAFRYPSRPDSPVLKDFSLDIVPGQTVALVGPSGSGKSTVFKLLLRFYDPLQGSIYLDGVDLRDADPQELRSRISLIPQHPVIFGRNAYENIQYGKLDATADEIYAAAQSAVADQFIDDLPDGIQSFVGCRGRQLSGGQRQRLAIARAMVRDSSVMLLDEATSSLDSENERLVHEAIDNVTENRTALIIAHRLSTVQRADRIIVMDAGNIVAEGTHHELVEEGGLYARFAELQFTV